MSKMWKIESRDSSLLGASKVIFDHDLRKIEAGGLTDWDLFPYKMTSQENFYERKHPKNLNPSSLTFKSYWSHGDECFMKKCIEGKWVLDGDTWIYMMPKLYTYINYVTITGTNPGERKRHKIKPDLSSLEFAQFSYIMIGDEFSGMDGDDEYTCNNLVELLYEGKELHQRDLDKLEKYGCYKPNGELKTFIDPWEYLTRFYLVDNPRGPLGQPLYFNDRQNVGVFGSRATAKSYIAYEGDFFHAYTFGDVKTWVDRKYCNSKQLFAMGCHAKDAINRSIKLIKSFYDDQPGQYKYPNPDRPDYMGPMYKNVQGTWEAGKEINHIVKNKQQISQIIGSSLQMNVITPDRLRIAAGDRFLGLYFEEAGFLEHLSEVHAANKDSMEEGDFKVGKAYYTGTSGDLIAVKGIKALNDSPKGYQMATIPNYWKNPDKRICLFLSAIYKYRKYKLEGGSNDLITALEIIAKERVENVETMDSMSFDNYVLYAPITPDEMLRPNKRSFLPSKEAADRLSDIEAYDYYTLNATVGDFKFSGMEKYGVEFRKSFKQEMTPILEYNIDRSKIDLAGAPIIYEHPPQYIPDGLYWVIFDPVSKPGQGESMDASLNSVIVYKWFYTGDEQTLEDCIVAEWIGRHDQLEDTYELVIKMAKYFNAMVFPEVNTPGFVDWCRRNSYQQMLQPEANVAMKEINPNFQNRRGKVGFSIYGDKMKPWLLAKLRGWLMRKRGLNKDTGDFDSRTIEHILSPRILNEIINFSEKGNFDHISSLLGLMLLITQFEEDPPSLEEKDKDDGLDRNIRMPKKRKKRSSFEMTIYN